MMYKIAYTSAHKAFVNDIESMFDEDQPLLKSAGPLLSRDKDGRSNPKYTLRLEAAVCYIQSLKREDGKPKYPNCEAEWLKQFIIRHKCKIVKKASNLTVPMAKGARPSAESPTNIIPSSLSTDAVAVVPVVIPSKYNCFTFRLFIANNCSVLFLFQAQARCL